MMMGYGMGLGILVLLVFLGGLIFLAVWLANSLFGNRRNSNQPRYEHGPSAKEILDQRYARGEITREQYDLMKHDLG